MIVGADDGAGVGDTVGPDVVGTSDGELDGLAVGDSVGIMVGARLR